MAEHPSFGSSLSYRLSGTKQFLHDVYQDQLEESVLKAVVASLYPELVNKCGGKIQATLTLVARAQDEQMMVEWSGWSVGRLSASASDVARRAMRKQGNRAYLPSHVDGEVLIEAGKCQVWVDLPAADSDQLPLG